jgi:tRNA(Glu) U13 pseudouridine synthase TruD
VLAIMPACLVRGGSADLRRDYSGAVDAVLGHQSWGAASSGEASARAAWVESRNARLALRLMPEGGTKGCPLEHQLLRMLVWQQEEEQHQQQLRGQWNGAQRAPAHSGKKRARVPGKGSPLSSSPSPSSSDHQGRAGGSFRSRYEAAEEAACRAAFLSVPLQLRTLIVFAYFNVLWNRLASERVRRCVQRSTDENAPRSTDRNAPLRPLRTGSD